MTTSDERERDTVVGDAGNCDAGIGRAPPDMDADEESKLATRADVRPR